MGERLEVLRPGTRASRGLGIKYRRPLVAHPSAVLYFGMPSATRRRTVSALIGGVPVGSDHPVVVQSMTNTDTADVMATARQVAELARAGSELVRVTVDRPEAAAAVPHIKDRL